MKNFTTISDPGLSLVIIIERKTDGATWDGSDWNVGGSDSIALTERENYATDSNGNPLSEYYSTTEPTSECYWRIVDGSNVFYDRGEYDPRWGVQATISDLAPTLADLKAWLNIVSTNTDDDAVLTAFATRAAAKVERDCGRLFTQSERTYYSNGSRNERLYLEDWPIVAVDSIKFSDATPRSYDTAIDSNTYVLPYAGSEKEAADHILSLSGSWYKGNLLYKVVATTGYSSLPADLYEGVMELAAHLYLVSKHRRLGVSSQAVDGGNAAYDFERGIPALTKAMVDAYRTKQF